MTEAEIEALETRGRHFTGILDDLVRTRAALEAANAKLARVEAVAAAGLYVREPQAYVAGYEAVMSEVRLAILGHRSGV